MQGSGWLLPQVALLHTWVGEDQCRVNPIQRCYLSHTPWAIIIIIIIIIMALRVLKNPSYIKILSQIVKYFKSAWKNCHHLNSHYTSCEHCNSNTATHHSYNVQTNPADQTFYYSRGTWIWPLGYQPEGEAHHYPIQCGLELSGATHLLQFMPTWCGQGKLLLCCCSATLYLEWR